MGFQLIEFGFPIMHPPRYHMATLKNGSDTTRASSYKLRKMLTKKKDMHVPQVGAHCCQALYFIFLVTLLTSGARANPMLDFTLYVPKLKGPQGRPVPPGSLLHCRRDKPPCSPTSPMPFRGTPSNRVQICSSCSMTQWKGGLTAKCLVPSS
jgi:hypothetical protein